MGQRKSLRVQGCMIDPEFIDVLKEIKLSCHDGIITVLHSSMLWHQWVHRVLLVHGEWHVQGFHLSYPSRAQNQCRRPLLVCCFREDYNIMACRICLNRFWLDGGKAIILIDFPFNTCTIVVNPPLWMPINAQKEDCTSDQYELHQYHQIHC